MKSTVKKNRLVLLLMCLFGGFISSVLTSCGSNAENNKIVENSNAKKIGILLVNHGSRSETWRNALLTLESNVKNEIMSNGEVKGVKTAFMEYNEPSIATRLKEFDADGFTDVIIVPIFLTVSPHSFDDIPTIIGQKEDPHSAEMLKIEKIERYTPKAKTHLTPLLDFTDILQKNILSRAKLLSVNPEKEGLTMIAYGDEKYVKEWSDLLGKVGSYVCENTGMKNYSFGWCGNIAHYKDDSTTVAINRVLQKTEKSIVIPVLVAHDEMFQVKIIGDGIAKVKDSKNRVVYKPDAILPDKNVETWVIDIAKKFVASVKENKENL